MLDILNTAGSGRELLESSIGADPFEHLHELEEAGKRKAKAEGTAYQLEHERKIILATIASEIAEVHAKENLSEARLDRMARADERYRKHIEGTAAAIEEREHARSEYWRIRAELDWMEKTVAHVNVVAKLGQPG